MASRIVITEGKSWEKVRSSILIKCLSFIYNKVDSRFLKEHNRNDLPGK